MKPILNNNLLLVGILLITILTSKLIIINILRIIKKSITPFTKNLENPL